MGFHMGKEKDRGKRRLNYELLRIIAMLMVITLHYKYAASAGGRRGQQVDSRDAPGIFLYCGGECICVD